MNRKFMVAAVFTVLTSGITAAAEVGPLVQSKYPGISGGPADQVLVDQAPVRLSSVLTESNEPSVLPYVIVPDDRYATELSRYMGYAGKAENLVQIRGRKTAIFKSSEIQLKMRPPATAFLNYPGILGRPANYIVMGGVQTVLVKKSEYGAFLRKHIGVADLPANYVVEDGKVIQTLPVDDVEFAPLFFQQVSPNLDGHEGAHTNQPSGKAGKALRESSGNAVDSATKGINAAPATP